MNKEINSLREEVIQFKTEFKEFSTDMRRMMGELASTTVTTKKDVNVLSASVVTLSTRVVNLEFDVKEMKGVLNETRAGVQLNLDRMDHFVKRVKVIGDKDLVQDYRLTKLEERTVAHEKRISKLESNE